MLYQIRVDYPLFKKAGEAGEAGGEERGVIKADLVLALFVTHRLIMHSHIAVFTAHQE